MAENVGSSSEQLPSSIIYRRSALSRGIETIMLAGITEVRLEESRERFVEHLVNKRNHLSLWTRSFMRSNVSMGTNK